MINYFVNVLVIEGFDHFIFRYEYIIRNVCDKLLC